MANIKGTKRGSYKPKKLNFEHICIECNATYKSADVKGKICSSCKEQLEIECGCGCGCKFKRAKYQINKGKIYWINHDKIGKTYLEIYGTSSPGCGFKRGNQNPMSDPNALELVLSKINKGKWYDGIKFRSSYEVEIYKILKSKSIQFEYEPILKTNEGLCFKPDFVIDNKIFIEVSGYGSAFEKGRARNLFKINKLVQSYDLLIFITSGRFVEWYQEKIDITKIIVLCYEKVIKDNNILWNQIQKRYSTSLEKEILTQDIES